MREQLWLLPSVEADRPLRATLFRPERTDADSSDVRRPLVIINHGTNEDTRQSVAMPVYYWLSRWFVERGFVVIVPQRRGHGATGGELSESIGTCADPDHFASGVAGADDIAAVVDYMIQQPFVDRRRVTVVGVSTGGWASLAYAARNPPSVEAVVNFAGGRGGHAYGRASAICNAGKLIDAARRFGEQARIPTIWLYAGNDSYFGPEVAGSLASAWEAGGGRVERQFLPSYGDEGHAIAEDRAGWDVWGDALQNFLDRIAAGRSKDLEMAGQPGIEKPVTADPANQP
jgi:dienelactone hydrolase